MQLIQIEKMPLPSEDPVNRPSHYLAASVSIEPIELTSRLDSCLGQAIQYVLRAPFKGNEREDLKKAAFYLSRRIDLLKYSATHLPVFFNGETVGFISAFQKAENFHVAQEFICELFAMQDKAGFASTVQHAQKALKVIADRLEELDAQEHLQGAK